MNRKIKNIFVYIFTIILVSFIFLFSLKLKNIFPFGNIDLAKYDAYYQYKPMLYQFILSIKNGTLTSFQFLNGLGNPTIFNYLYYLASPLNLFALPFRSPEMMYFIIIFIKTIFTSICSLFYFKKRTYNQYFISVICALSYTFSGWYFAYYMHIMWLDAFMVFPLLQYGLEELIHKNKIYIYILSLAYIMISNFYMAFMVCIYVFIYYMFHIIVKKDKYINKIKNFQLIMFSTIFTCLLCSFTIYATYSTFLKMGIYIDDNYSFIASLKFFDFLKSFFHGNFSPNLAQFYHNIPNISLPVVFIISFVYYFVNNKISFRERLFTLIAVVFLSFVLFSNKMNYLINCFHTPAGFSFRYSFIISFYILILFLRNLNVFENKIDFRCYFISILFFLLFVVELFIGNMDFTIFVFNVSFLFSYNVLFLFYSKNRLYKGLFLGVILLELLISFSLALKDNDIELSTSYPKYQNNYSSIRKKINDTVLYTDRINQNLYSNTHTIETFSSMQYHNVLGLLNDLGCATDLKAMVYSCNNTSLFHMIFHVEDQYTLPQIFAIKEDIFLYTIGTDDFIENQNNMILGMSGEKNVIKTIHLKPQQKEPYIYKILDDDSYIIKIDPSMKYLRINEHLYFSDYRVIPDKYKSFILNSDLLRKKMVTFDLKKGDEIEIAYFDKAEEDNLSIYSVDLSKLEKVYQYLLKGSIKYTSNQSDMIEGNIEVLEDEILFTSIPYDDSWKIEIDGKSVEPIILFDSLLAIPCSSGKHTIKMYYKIDFKLPIILSFLSFLFILFGLFYKIIFKKD